MIVSWILFTFLAAFSQAWRNAFQSQLSKTLNVTGVTLARFLWASPLALIYLVALYQWQPTDLPTFTGHSWFFLIGASIMQIVATALMVVLFKQKNFAIGAGLAKSEAPVSAFLGVLFFGTSLTFLGWIGVLVGGVAVLILSCPQGFRSISINTAALGLACSSAFALTSLWIREASLSLSLPFPHRAAWVLFIVILLQTIMLVGYLLIRDRGTLKQMLAKPKLVVMTSIASFVGSFGWFSAMSLQAVPYVKTLGQVEIFFTMLVSFFYLKESIPRKDIFALLLVAVAAGLVMWQ
ncbi:multidrug transporter [Vibrio breoganii]|uniref:Multidrug transporter n=1 Tax=Vibrio breoganii TaxID=553239 RepID=A0AAN0XYM5_9VIBR|nr:DMT family transporter [Vibrio breoganii]ANO35024.1 multidrug transporter [Vibrio breoganii]OCH76949.1 multidrug transporter [Vibrio breoganii]PMK42442.1 multidrug transporter [Vibrio breoganii]PML07561.1 multidrug transporter [Vibrio breoganii]PMO27818.1 multidrug transporter [Vibrio breoganii]